MVCPPSSTNSSEELQPLLLTYHMIVLFLGVFGNIAVIIHNIFLNHDKTWSSWLVTHLAFADLLVCLAIYPTKISKGFENQHRKSFFWAWYTAYFASTFISIMTLLLITVDKYLYIARPLKYPMIVTKRRIFTLISCIWVAALVPPAIKYCIKERVFPVPNEETKFVSLLVILLLIPIGVIAILNYKMFKIVKEQRQRIALEVVLQQPSYGQSQQVQSEQNQTWLRRLAKEFKAVKTFAIVVGVLIFCFAPHMVANVMKMHGVCHTLVHDVRMIGNELVAINSILNAYIYALRHNRYRKAYKQLLSSAWARLFPPNN